MINAKSLTKEDCEYILSSEGYKTKPMLHQHQALIWSADKNRIAYFFGIGTGKTLTALYTHNLWETKRLLVVSPNSVIPVWGEQIEEHTNSSYTIMKGPKKKRRELLWEDTDIFVVNYEGLQVLFGDRIKIGNKTRLKLNYSMIKQAGFDGIILDECHRTKNRLSQFSKITHELSKRASNVIIMTGSPIAKTEQDLWSEFYTMDDGLSLGTNFYSFLHQYFKERWFDWVIKKGAREKILERISPVTLRYSREECLDLPEKVYEKRYIDMSKEQNLSILEIIQGLKPDIALGEIDAKNILSWSSKLAQIPGGFMYVDKGDELSRIGLRLDNPKGKELTSLFEEIGNDEKLIIFHEYQEEGRIIEEICKKNKIAYASMRSEIKDTTAEYHRFKQQKNCRVLIAHPKSGGEGLNFQDVCSIIIFYSNGYSGAIERKQCEGRIWRQGQKKKCLFIDMIMKNSIDERKQKVIRQRKEMANEILDYIKNW